MIFEGKFKLCGIEYECKVINGLKTVNGLSIDNFIDQLPIDAVIELAKLGDAINKGFKGSSQRFVNESRQSKLN